MANFITPIRSDVAVFRTLVEHRTPVTRPVLGAVWRWFPDVEIAVPLPVMPLTDEERAGLALSVLTEMDEVFARIEARCEGRSEEENAAETTGPDAEKVNSLWRELAGVYADMVNAEVGTVPPENRAEVYASAVESLAEMTGMEEFEVRELLRSDSRFRMMVRMAGLDPDQIP